MKKIIYLILCLLLITTGCKRDYSKGTIDNITYHETKEITNYVKLDTTKGIILIELFPEIAPITVKNFQDLVNEKFYDGLIFHRVVKNFVIQAGDPEGTGFGGSNKTIKGEFKNNGVENNLSHIRGVISMARNTVSMDSASSQFFVVVKDSTNLDGDYAAFGKVIAGLDVVDKISEVDVDFNDKPNIEQKINSIKFIEIEG